MNDVGAGCRSVPDGVAVGTVLLSGIEEASPDGSVSRALRDPGAVAFPFCGNASDRAILPCEEGLPFELGLTGLLDGIKELHKVNERLVERICRGVKKDAAINSLVILDTIASLLEIDLDANLDELRSHFGVYLEAV